MKNSQTSSIRPDRPLWRVYLALALITLASAALSLMLGPVSLSPGEVISAFFKSEAVTSADRIALYARLPRTCGCIVAGAALAVSGAIIQGVLSNPLAAPNVIGVNSGAGLAAAVCCAFLPGAYALVPFAAFLGALLSVLLVLLIAERTGASKITLVLGGVAISSVLSAGVDAVVTFVPDALVGYSDFRIGSLSGLTMQKLAPAAWVVLAALALSFSLTHELDLLMLGRDTAGAAVSFAGLLGFIGLIVPHIMRRLVGDESRLLLPGCAMGGAVMLLLCDLASRMLFRPYELPVGIALSFIGGPFFVWLLLRQRKGRTHD